jgi:hypothetical protein
MPLEVLFELDMAVAVIAALPALSQRRGLIMANLNANDLKSVGDNVLGLLKSDGTLRYSLFYSDDGTDEALDALSRGTGIDSEECLILLDGAIDQLAKANLVVIRVTEDVLPDGKASHVAHNVVTKGDKCSK